MIRNNFYCNLDILLIVQIFNIPNLSARNIRDQQTNTQPTTLVIIAHKVNISTMVNEHAILGMKGM